MKLQTFVVQLFQVLRHCGDVLVRAVIELQQVRTGQQLLFLHGGAIARELFLSAVGGGVIEIDNVLNAGREHLQRCVIHGIEVIGHDAVDIRRIQSRIEQHDRNLGGGLNDIVIVGILLIDEVGTDEDDAVHLLCNKKIHGGNLGIQLVAGTAENTVVAV